ncbi:MAG TPA: hypothetical protein EYP30_04680, partial [Archaeoglobaceae archaeon]|nr:hypothetical protein [Archaeoglobaceae archaeon]
MLKGTLKKLSGSKKIKTLKKKSKDDSEVKKKKKKKEEEEISKTQRYKAPLTLVIFGIDHFRKINNEN